VGEEIACAVWGDPHVVTWDLFRLFGNGWNEDRQRNRDHRGDWFIGEWFIPDLFRVGDYWIVQSERISIQGQYRIAGGWTLHGIAVGGAFMQGHVFAIEQIWDGAAVVLWDGEEVADPNTFDFDGIVSMSLTRFGNGKIQQGLVTLPEGASLRVGMLFNTIVMRKQPDEMGGHCGKADGDLTDDNSEYLYAQGADVSPEDCLFREPFSDTALVQVAAPSLQHCSSAPAEHVTLCRNAFEQADYTGDVAEAFIRGCAFDVCYTEDPENVNGALGAMMELVALSEGMQGNSAGSSAPMIRWSYHSNRCASNDFPANGTRITTQECDGASATTRWLLPPSGTGLIRWAAHSNFCLDVASGSTADGTPIQLWRCKEGHTNMQFILPETGTGPIRWKAHPSKCLDVTDAKTALGTQIQLWTCIDSSPHQKFTVG